MCLCSYARISRTATLAMACLVCDAEAQGCTEEEIEALKRGFAKAEREKS